VTPGYVDLHAHYLPGIDDGAPDLKTGLEMVDAITSMGFTTLCATPHQRAGMYLPSAEQIEAALSEVRTALASRPNPPEIGIAAENYWDEIFAGRALTGTQPTYPGGKAFLFEVPVGQMPANLDDQLFRMRLSGLLPVMAHPERYRAVQEDLTRAEKLGQRAALLVDLAALEGAFGRPQKKTARRLVEEGLVHAVATDLHAPSDARAVAGGIEWLRKRMGESTVTRLLSDNPRRILAGELP